MTDAFDAESPTAQDGLPPWAVVSPTRHAHVQRVVALLRAWTVTMRLPADESARWLRAGWLHDALRDAPEDEMRRWAPTVEGPVELRHGPAAAARAELEGESDTDVISAVRWHSVGWLGWGRCGRALYCADFLEPGRSFAREERARWAAEYPAAPDEVLREVVAARFAYADEQGWSHPPESIAFRRMILG